MLFTLGECCYQIFITLERTMNVEIMAWRLRKPWPLDELVLAQIPVMFNSLMARPNQAGHAAG
ncbi:hypothetical protein KML002_33690 [Klebsiella quasipneumoniae subsp. similipneumoniae]|nr:hypothetical protein KML002_33690 [Klebsiella quasipneumoniae subsp. similipneumoniae]